MRAKGIESLLERLSYLVQKGGSMLSVQLGGSMSGGSGPHSLKSSISYWGKPILSPWQKLADVHFRGRVGRIELLDIGPAAYSF